MQDRACPVFSFSVFEVGENKISFFFSLRAKSGEIGRSSGERGRGGERGGKEGEMKRRMILTSTSILPYFPLSFFL